MPYVYSPDQLKVDLKYVRYNQQLQMQNLID